MVEITVESIPNHSRIRVTLPDIPPIGSTVDIGGYLVSVDHYCYHFVSGKEEIKIQTELNINLNRLE